METFEIDLALLFSVLRKRLILIAIAAFSCAAVAFSCAQFLITPQYRATVKLYVYSDPERETSRSSVTTAELSASQSLVDTYLVILQSDTVLEEVLDRIDLDITATELRQMMSSSSINGTEVFSVTVTHPNPAMAQILANTIADVAPAEIIRVVKAGGVEVVDYAKLPESPSYPYVYKYTLIGFAGGAILCYGVFVLLALLDTKIRDEDDLAKYNLPVLGIVPAFEAIASDKDYGSSGYSKEYGKGPEAVCAGKGK